MVYSNNLGQSRVGIRNLVVNVVNSVDADAIAFITAAGITNLTQAAAINTLVNDLKTYGLWTKMKALYPMVGGSATSHKFNLKDPRDVDAAYRLTFNGGWTHSSTGALPNGTTGYANTFLTPSSGLTLNSTHISYYSRTQTTDDNKTEIGCSSNANELPIMQMYIRRSNSVYSDQYDYTNNRIIAANTNTTGLFLSTRTTNNSHKVYRNNSLLGSDTNTSTQNVLPSKTMTIAAYNYSTDTNGIIRYSTKETAFASIGDGLSDTEATNFYNSVQKFQTTLGRQIGSPIVSDTDAQAFLNAAAITDLGQANAVNTLVVDLKAAGVWTKMKALYPMVGGTATTHKWNLKDPRDLDAAFRLTFSGGWTHSATGALPNGTTGYADTFLTPSTSLQQNSVHISYYSRTNMSHYGIDFGVYAITPQSCLYGVIKDTDGKCYFRVNRNASIPESSQAMTSASIFFMLNRVAGYSGESLFVNNTKTSFGQTSTGLSNYKIPLGALSNAGTYQSYSIRESAFASIGDGLTDAEALAFYTAIQKYQTTLGRQIGTPVLAEGQTAGLLETYSGAAAAYSLRKLRTGYVGNAIRVRRSSDNAEQDIAFDVNGNLDTTSLLAFVGSGNGFVTTWYDQSGFNNHITQTTAGNQPQIVSSGVVKLLNNKPSIYFDGSSTYFNSSTQTVLSTGGGGYSIFGTAKPSGTSGPKCLFYIGSASGNNGVGFNLHNTQPRHYWFANDFDTSQTFSDTNTIYAVSYDGSKRYTAINNVTQSQNATGKNTISPILMVGKLQGYGQTFIGLQSELIIYDSYKDTSITNIYGSMNSYYSIY